jgi:raffinose/stachyose/melibiose transport system substrate-binding protein
MKRIPATILAILMLITSAACSNTPSPASSAAPQATTPASQAAPASQAPAATEEPVTIKLFSNLPDRKSGQGLLEETLIQNYEAEHKNVKIEVEALQDEAYKQKFKAYTSSNSLPDVMAVWGQPAFIDPVINSGYLAELKDDYSGYNFIKGSLNGFSKDGKVYGLPRNTDMMVFYYNKKIFKDNGVEVPKTMDDLVAMGKKFNGLGITPCVMDGKDKYPLAIMYSDFVMKTTGDNKLVPKAASGGGFSDPAFLKSAQNMSALIGKDFFQKSFSATDYGAARNMFAQSKAATYYMGAWEMGMVTDETLPEDFRKNIGIFMMPSVSGGAGKATDIAAWNGGGYSVSANSKVKTQAIEFLNYIYKPENWAKNAWQMGLCFPAQNFDQYLTGKETEVQTALTDILSKSTSISGTPINDCGTPAFKTACEDLSQQFAVGMITPEQYIQKLNDALK